MDPIIAFILLLPMIPNRNNLASANIAEHTTGVSAVEPTADLPITDLPTAAEPIAVAPIAAESGIAKVAQRIAIVAGLAELVAYIAGASTAGPITASVESRRAE